MHDSIRLSVVLFAAAELDDVLVDAQAVEAEVMREVLADALDGGRIRAGDEDDLDVEGGRRLGQRFV